MSVIKGTNDKIKIMSFLCTAIVVLRHSRNYLAFFGTKTGYGITGFIEDSVSVFTQIAVPTFFIISGYFFFKYDYYKDGNYLTMTKKKFKTLVIPFLFWNIVGAMVLSLYAPELIGNTIYSELKNLLMSNWNGPLWYVRDIILIMLFAPVYSWIFKLNNWLLYIIVCGLLFFRWWPIDTTVFSSEGLLFFFIGGVIRKHKYILEYKIPIMIFIVMAICWCTYCFDLIDIYNKNLHRINTMIGILVLWRLIDFIGEKQYNILYQLSAYSFFIYVSHTYLVKIIKRSIAYYFYGDNIVALLAFFIVPIMAIAIALIIAKYWKQHSPNTYLLITGGR